jgi:hypothetical protein
VSTTREAVEAPHYVGDIVRILRVDVTNASGFLHPDLTDRPMEPKN